MITKFLKGRKDGEVINFHWNSVKARQEFLFILLKFSLGFEILVDMIILSSFMKWSWEADSLKRVWI